jgi:hypothetical protein
MNAIGDAQFGSKPMQVCPHRPVANDAKFRSWVFRGEDGESANGQLGPLKEHQAADEEGTKAAVAAPFYRQTGYLFDTDRRAHEELAAGEPEQGEAIAGVSRNPDDETRPRRTQPE